MAPPGRSGTHVLRRRGITIQHNKEEGMLKKEAEVERFVLETVYDKGCLMANTDAQQVLNAKYPSESQQQFVTVTLQYLLEERYLWPYFDKDGNELRSGGFTRGVTPKGIARLRKLRNPSRHWMSNNWFPLLIAGFSAGIAITNMVVNL